MDSIPDSLLVYIYPFAPTKSYWYWQINNTHSAIDLLESHHVYHCNQRIHTLLGRWYQEIGDFKAAESHFKTALYYPISSGIPYGFNKIISKKGSYTNG
jgi:hypothetical protein